MRQRSNAEPQPHGGLRVRGIGTASQDFGAKAVNPNPSLVRQRSNAEPQPHGGLRVRGIGTASRDFGAKTVDPNPTSQKNTVKHEEISRMGPEGTRGGLQNTCRMQYFVFCTFYQGFEHLAWEGLSRERG